MTGKMYWNYEGKAGEELYLVDILSLSKEKITFRDIGFRNNKRPIALHGIAGGVCASCTDDTWAEYAGEREDFADGTSRVRGNWWIRETDGSVQRRGWFRLEAVYA